MIKLLFIPLLPLTAAFILCFPFEFLKRKAGIVSMVSVLASLILTITLTNTEIKIGFTWFSSSAFNLTFSLMMEGLGWFLSLIVSVVGSIVIVYSIKFIEERKEFYFRVISFFIGSMLLLVLSDSFILTFIAWEFVGLSSFLLIGFWYKETAAKEASRKAFLMTRIGDFGFLLALLLILVNYGSTDISLFLKDTGTNSVLNLNHNLNLTPTLLSLLFLTAAIGKSAQLPFTSWLPDAMVGPAPVSALIHSATMVAAGVFLILKLFPLYEASPFTLNLILWIGLITSLLAALVASTRFDIKRILAWSTISQLGEMYFVIGLSGALAASFHLAAQAVFKAGLFLTAGVIGHTAGSKDIRELGNLKRYLPYTMAVFILCGLALAGFPPFAGFWSEDEIIKETLKYSDLYTVFMLLLIFLAGVYISRAGFAAFGNWKGNKNPKAKEKGKVIIYSMSILAVLAFAAGYVLKLSIKDLLPFSSSGEVGWGWRSAAIAASAGGLSFGIWRTKKSGPVPSLGKVFSSLEKIPEIFVFIPVHVIEFFSRSINKIEDLFDTGAAALSGFILSSASLEVKTEFFLDKAAGHIESSTIRSAKDINSVELRGFTKSLDELAFSFSIAGSLLRKIQTGKIFLYTIFLFSWIAITALAVGIFFLF